MEKTSMPANQEQKPKRRGRPPGSKNKVKKIALKLGRGPGRPRKQLGSANEMTSTIMQLLALPASDETKVRLIRAALQA